MDHVVRPLGVLDHPVEDDEPGCHHDRQHDRVSPVEGVLLDEVGKHRQGHCEPHEKQRHGVPLRKS